MHKYLFGWVQHKAAGAVDIAIVTGPATWQPCAVPSQTNYANDLSSTGSLQGFLIILSHAILCSVKLN